MTDETPKVPEGIDYAFLNCQLWCILMSDDQPEYKAVSQRILNAYIAELVDNARGAGIDVDERFHESQRPKLPFYGTYYVGSTEQQERVRQLTLESTTT